MPCLLVNVCSNWLRMSPEYFGMFVNILRNIQTNVRGNRYEWGARGAKEMARKNGVIGGGVWELH